MKSGRYIKLVSRAFCEFRGKDNRNEYNWDIVKVGGISFA
jgi:hypothetical protein